MEQILSLLQIFLSFAVIISVIVFIHEFGHYYFAKKCGVKVEEFSIGFGKEIFGWNDKFGTRWKFSYIPLGGYVKMFGDAGAASTPDNEGLQKLTNEERKQAFAFKPLWQKSLIVFGGPLANFLLAIVIFTFLLAIYGKNVNSAQIGNVVEGGAAYKAGLQAGDKIIKLDGKKIDTFQDLQSIVGIHPDIEVKIVYQRGEKQIEGKITPELKEVADPFGNNTKIGFIGVTSGAGKKMDLNIFQAFYYSFGETYKMAARTLEAIGQMITGQRSTQELTGILRIADYSGKAVEKSFAEGFYFVFWFMAIISINLGLINLFPIPLLDGGHLFFYAIEAIIRRPVPEKMMEYFYRFGFSVLIFLMLYATFNDVRALGFLDWAKGLFSRA